MFPFIPLLLQMRPEGLMTDWQLWGKLEAETSSCVLSHTQSITTYHVHGHNWHGAGSLLSSEMVAGGC